MKEQKITKENMEPKEVPKNKNKKRGKVILILILLAIAIVVGLYFGLERLNSNPLSVYKRAINETYQLLDDFLGKNEKGSFTLDPTKEAFLVDTNFTIDIDDEELSLLNNYNYDLSLGLDYPNNQMNVALGLNDEEEEILNLLLSFLNDHAYLQSEELYDQILDLGEATLELDLSALSSEEMPKLDKQNLHIILSEMKDIIINSLDQEKFSVSEETVEINGSKIEGKKFTYLLDQENMERTINYVTKEMIANDELMNALANITGLTTEELTDSLQEEIDYSDYEEININLYTDGSQDIIAGSVVEKEEAVIRFTYQEEILNMFIGDEYSNATINKEGNTITFSYSEYDEELLVATISLEEEEKVIEVTVNDYGDTITCRLAMRNTEEQENSFSSDFTLNLEMNSYEANMNIELDGTLKIEKKELTTLDPTNSVEIDSLSEEDQALINENLLKVLEKLNLNEYLAI